MAAHHISEFTFNMTRPVSSPTRNQLTFNLQPSRNQVSKISESGCNADCFIPCAQLSSVSEYVASVSALQEAGGR